MNILVTGGAGYIGSHTIIELITAGHKVVALDNLSNASPESLRRVAKIVGHEIPLHTFDLQDSKKLAALFQSEKFDAVIHFAGLKAVGESVKEPLKYYQVNLGSTLSLLEAMNSHNVKRLVFSSSATVYGDPSSSDLPLKETSPTPAKVSSPYGQTKLMIEHILQDVAQADTSFQITILRYFNPVGAHLSGLIGEDPDGPPNNLMPYISQVAVGQRDELIVHGDDYPTKDGTGVRDYIHVVDLAKGHVAALSAQSSTPTSNLHTYNLGTGRGYSVLEMIVAFSQASGKPIPYSIGPRRPGDIASCYCDPSHARQELNWHAQADIAAMCRDSWNWQKQNPQGYKT